MKNVQKLELAIDFNHSDWTTGLQDRVLNLRLDKFSSGLGRVGPVRSRFSSGIGRAGLLRPKIKLARPGPKIYKPAPGYRRFIQSRGLEKSLGLIRFLENIER